MSDPLSPLDTPYKRAEFRQAAIAQQEALLEAIRERRLQTVQAYTELVEQKRVTTVAILRDKWDKQIALYTKSLDATGLAIKRLEDRIKKLKTIALELEINDG